MDSREAAERARLAETFLFRGAPPEAVELARTDPRTLRQENGKGGVIYAPHAFRRCLGVVLEGRVQVNKGALIMSVLEPGDLFGAAALFNDRADYATTLTARAPCRVLLLPQALVEELMVRFPEVGRNYRGLPVRPHLLSQRQDRRPHRRQRRAEGGPVPALPGWRGDGWSWTALPPAWPGGWG